MTAIVLTFWWVSSDPIGDAVRQSLDGISNDPIIERDIDYVADDYFPSGTVNFLSLFDLYSTDVSMECAYNYVSKEGYVGEGTIFYQGGRYRVSSMYSLNEEVFVSNTIKDDMYIFSWGENQQGAFTVKVHINQVEILEKESYLFLNQEVPYYCKDWEPDLSIFNVPNQIDFSYLDGSVSN